MSISALPSGLHPDDYEKIEAAVMETVRGRWFLLEYARRQRASETERLEQAIRQLEQRVAAQGAAAAPLEAGLHAERIAEKLQDFAWVLRERGLDEALCHEIEVLARETADLAHSPGRPLELDAGQRKALARVTSAEVASVIAEREPEGSAASPNAVDPRLIALSRLDNLSLSEKLMLFG